jgi:hypothetical protein
MMMGCVALVAVVGCGGSGDGADPKAACQDQQVTVCERFYTCYTADELEAIGFPPTEAACVTMLQASEGCSQQTTENVCVGNERYHADQADDCLDQIAGLACSQVRNPDLDIELAAPACGKVCAVD